MKKYMVDHVCLLVKDLENAKRLFTEVFGMEPLKEEGQSPRRKIWLDGGIQLNETADIETEGGIDHFALDVPAEEMAGIFEKTLAYGCSQVPGVTPCQWIRMPDGQVIELTNVTRSFTQSKASGK